ncbi:G patch domain and ankyrin repeat-containing protein 1 [Dissophora globulifera]|uniref:G patch domain and ankyrin repeat-containing protein 1 n=1 Tax=Dissophora globulifera TaxID=979702 RepID=A0A9P6RFJ1_9FUNG|nr:G patch domain and ankyrin repeat-containing protein 1 [Dissophora globulifera]
MDNKRASRGGSKRVLRQDESGTYYRDIAFVPSGTLAMKEATGISVQTNKQDDAINVREIEVREDDMDRHRRGTAHLISQESHIKPLDTLALGHGNKGFRMLVNSGWDYEKGLGIEGQGKRHPVATRLKQDRLALGAAGSSKKVVTHTFEEIEKSRTKPAAKSERRVPLSLEDYQKQAEKERRDRVNLMTYMKK